MNDAVYNGIDIRRQRNLDKFVSISTCSSRFEDSLSGHRLQPMYLIQWSGDLHIWAIG